MCVSGNISIMAKLQQEEKKAAKAIKKADQTEGKTKEQDKSSVRTGAV